MDVILKEIRMYARKLDHWYVSRGRLLVRLFATYARIRLESFTFQHPNSRFHCSSLFVLDGIRTRISANIFPLWTSQLSDTDATTIVMSANSIVEDSCWKNSRPRGFFLILRYDEDAIREIWLCWQEEKNSLYSFIRIQKNGFQFLFQHFLCFFFIFSEVRYEYKLYGNMIYERYSFV